MTIANYEGQLIEAQSKAVAAPTATHWRPFFRFNFLKTYHLVDGTAYRGFRQLYGRTTADGRSEYRLMSNTERQQEAEDLRVW